MNETFCLDSSSFNKFLKTWSCIKFHYFVNTWNIQRITIAITFCFNGDFSRQVSSSAAFTNFWLFRYTLSFVSFRFGWLQIGSSDFLHWGAWDLDTDSIFRKKKKKKEKKEKKKKRRTLKAKIVAKLKIYPFLTFFSK